MRVVLDTNVLLSGIFFGGPPSKILKFMMMLIKPEGSTFWAKRRRRKTG